jgi:hypothetical protein
LSNDGSRLYIDNKLIVDNDGLHGTRQLGGEIHLNKGMYALRVDYFQSGGSKSLSIYYQSEKIPFQPVPASIMFLKRN